MDLEAVFRDNVVGAHVVTSAFLPLLRKGTQKKVANLSTTLGSMEMAPRYKVFPVPAYKVAKAALNMLTVQQALEYGEEGFTFLVLSPGVSLYVSSQSAEFVSRFPFQDILLI